MQPVDMGSKSPLSVIPYKEGKPLLQQAAPALPAAGSGEMHRITSETPSPAEGRYLWEKGALIDLYA